VPIDDGYGREGDLGDDTVALRTFSPGTFFAERFRIEAVLGSGAMGRVYRCRDVAGQRSVAVKVLHKDRVAERDTVERFRREAEALASIGHPCIVEVLAFHRTSDGTPYLVMELLEGVTLQTRIQSGGRFEDPRRLQPIVDGIAGALEAAHGAGVVHRDLKPENVFLPATGNPRVKLLDFGLSRVQAVDAITRAGAILGTPRYMAPEQMEGAAHVHFGVDVYSFGVIVFECLTGQSIYPADDYGQLLGCVIEGRTRRLLELRPDLPSALDAVVQRATRSDPKQRFIGAGALADAYGAAIGSPSRRDALFLGDVTERQMNPSLRPSASLVPSDESTLALDLRAMASPPPPAASTPPVGPAHPAPPATRPPSGPGAAPPSTPAPPAAGSAAPRRSTPPVAATVAMPQLTSGGPNPGWVPPSTPSVTPRPSTAPRPDARPPRPPPAPRGLSRGRLLLLLVLALLVVVPVSAGLGYALRTHLRATRSATP
jgi:serine/threonine protein kinase